METTADPEESLASGRILAKPGAPRTGAEPAWLRSTLEVLVGLLDLPQNWDSYGAPQVAPAAAAAALNLLLDLMPPTAPAPQIIPLADGGVQLEWHMGGIDLEVALRASGETFVLFEDLRTGEEWEGP